MNKIRTLFTPLIALTSALAAVLTFGFLNGRVNWIAVRHSLERSRPETFVCTIERDSYFETKGSAIVRFWRRDKTMQLQIPRTVGTLPWIPMGSTKDEQIDIPAMTVGPARTWPASDVVGDLRRGNVRLDANAPVSFLFSLRSPSGSMLSIGSDNVGRWWDEPSTANWNCRPTGSSQ